jgi:uncharacterized protein (TIGR02271 family)
MAGTVVGHFRDRASADSAYEELVRRGFDRDDISILGRGREGGKGLADDDHDVDAAEGAAAGGIFGLLLGAGAMLIPGVGPVLAIGPISAALAGAVTGGVTGAVVGGVTAALVDQGVPEDDARYYEDRFRQGGYLLTVRTQGDRYPEARALLERHGAETRGHNVQSVGRATIDNPARVTGYTEGERSGHGMDAGRGERKLDLHEEELRVRKETVEAGTVGVRKEVVTEQRSLDVPVTHEEVVVERHPVPGHPPASGPVGEREEVRVPVREERVEVDKQAVVTEEVTLKKRPVQEVEHVTETVRREEPRVEARGDLHRDEQPRRP